MGIAVVAGLDDPAVFPDADARPSREKMGFEDMALGQLRPGRREGRGDGGGGCAAFQRLGRVLKEEGGQQVPGGWGNICHKAAGCPLFDTIAFHGGSMKRVWLLCRCGANSSRSMSSHG